MQEGWDRAWALIETMLATPEGWVALFSVAVASMLVLAATVVKTMIPLRWLAVGSNIGFLAYAALAPSLPLFLLHAALLPINLWRVFEMMLLTRRVKATAAAADMSGLWLKPYMRPKRLARGRVIFRKGDFANRLYLLAKGRVELVESGVAIEPGRIFGEIAFFAPDRRRTFTARCLEPSQVLSIDETTMRQLYYQNPEFGYEMVSLVAGRLSADVQRLQAELAELRAQPAAHAGLISTGSTPGATTTTSA